VRPNRSDIEVDVIALAWAQNWQTTHRDRQGNVRAELSRAHWREFAQQSVSMSWDSSAWRRPATCSV